MKELSHIKNHSLHAYVRWVISQQWDVLSMRAIEARLGPGWEVDVVHRDENCQVERVSVPAGTIALHRHPGVETCEYFVCGSGVLQIGARRVELDESQPSSRQIVPIPSWAWHGGTVGPQGIVFLSIQQWRDDLALSSVAEVWDGPSVKVII